MARPDPARRAATRRRIIDAFWGLLEQMPLERITVRAVADAAGCNRSTFYQYFESIPDLLAQAEDDLIDEAQASTEHLADLRSLQDVVVYTAPFYESHSARYFALAGSDEMGYFLVRLVDHLTPATMGLLGLDPDDPDQAFWARNSILCANASLVHWYQQGKPIPLEEFTRGLDEAWLGEGFPREEGAATGADAQQG